MTHFQYFVFTLFHLLSLTICQQFALTAGNLNKQHRHPNAMDYPKGNLQNNSDNNTLVEIWIFLLCYFLVVICIVVAVTIFVLKKNLEKNTVNCNV